MVTVELLEKPPEIKERIMPSPREEAILGNLLEAIKEKSACNEKLLHETIKVLLENKNKK